MAQQTFSGVPGDFTAGQVLTAADMDKLREFLLYLIKDGDEGDTGETSPLILDLGNNQVTIDDDLVVGGTTQFTDPTVAALTVIGNSGVMVSGAATVCDFLLRNITSDTSWLMSHRASGGSNGLQWCWNGEPWTLKTHAPMPRRCLIICRWITASLGTIRPPTANWPAGIK